LLKCNEFLDYILANLGPSSKHTIMLFVKYLQNCGSLCSPCWLFY